MPAELHELSGVQTLFIFKVVYPVIGALFPVGVFCLGGRFIAGRWAFMAAALVIMQQTFFQEMPGLGETGNRNAFCSRPSSRALLDTTQSKRAPVGGSSVCLLSLGMVVSHYSTTYLAIPLFALSRLAEFPGFDPVPRASGVLLLAFGVCVSRCDIVVRPLTHSTSNLSQFKQECGCQGVSVLPNKGGVHYPPTFRVRRRQDLSPVSTRVYVKKYYRIKTYPFVTPLPDASDPRV